MAKVVIVFCLALSIPIGKNQSKVSAKLDQMNVVYYQPAPEVINHH